MIKEELITTLPFAGLKKSWGVKPPLALLVNIPEFSASSKIFLISSSDTNAGISEKKTILWIQGKLLYESFMLCNRCEMKMVNSWHKGILECTYKKQEISSSSLKACFVIAHSSGDKLIIVDSRS